MRQEPTGPSSVLSIRWYSKRCGMCCWQRCPATFTPSLRASCTGKGSTSTSMWLHWDQLFMPRCTSERRSVGTTPRSAALSLMLLAGLGCGHSSIFLVARILFSISLWTDLEPFRSQCRRNVVSPPTRTTCSLSDGIRLTPSTFRWKPLIVASTTLRVSLAAAWMLYCEPTVFSTAAWSWHLGSQFQLRYLTKSLGFAQFQPATTTFA
mmetsp:Transcript_29534/g.75714  ORF Transcript_29534/g.75714 Transcript_29534/m.75714 type:complete len:208 (+) Transcript_29534:758-1381(+)